MPSTDAGPDAGPDAGSERPRSIFALRLSLYRAIDDPERCARYLRCHLEMLRHFHLMGLTSRHPDWFANPNVHVIEIESAEGGELLAGARVHLADGLHDLPTEKAFTTGPDVRDFVKDHLTEGTGEICGAWVSRRLASLGILQLLGCTSFAVAAPLGLRTAIGSCGKHTLPVHRNIGCLIERAFQYPEVEHESFVWVVPDLITCEHAIPECRDLTLDLRRNPRQRRTIESPRAAIDIDVDLRIPA